MQTENLKKEKLIWLGIMAICAVFMLLETVSAVLHERPVLHYFMCGVPAGALAFTTYKGLMNIAFIRQYQNIVWLVLLVMSFPISFIYSHIGEPVSYANRSSFLFVIAIAGVVMCGISSLYVRTGKSILYPELK